eukprot:18299-Eustigmatos_ZCMA.PRE.1
MRKGSDVGWSESIHQITQKRRDGLYVVSGMARVLNPADLLKVPGPTAEAYVPSAKKRSLPSGIREKDVSDEPGNRKQA